MCDQSFVLGTLSNCLHSYYRPPINLLIIWKLLDEFFWCVSLKSHCLMWPPSFGAFKCGREILIFRICQVFVSFYKWLYHYNHSWVWSNELPVITYCLKSWGGLDCNRRERLIIPSREHYSNTPGQGTKSWGLGVPGEGGGGANIFGRSLRAYLCSGGQRP